MWSEKNSKIGDKCDVVEIDQFPFFLLFRISLCRIEFFFISHGFLKDEHKGYTILVKRRSQLKGQNSKVQST